jgi:hypothetical protein
MKQTEKTFYESKVCYNNKSSQNIKSCLMQLCKGILWDWRYGFALS